MSYVEPAKQAVFQVVRNPVDPALTLVGWDTVDTRTQAVVNTAATQPDADTDADTRNQTLNPLGG